MFIKKNNKWYCEKHENYLEICTNRSNGSIFLKCPCNEHFECGTIDEGQFNPKDYDYYTPNLERNMAYDMLSQIEDDDIDYFYPSENQITC